MSTTTTDQSVPFPVDSATRPCCGGIGAHARNCPAALRDVAPPAGAEAMCDWADWGNEFRFVTADHRVEGTNFVLSPCAAQLPDGSIDTETTVTNDPPHVTIYEFADGETGNA